jgi:microcystin-dependent protein
MNIERIFLVISILSIIIMYSKIKNVEHMTNNSDSETFVKNLIKKEMNYDVESIRNLGAISKSLLTGKNYHNTNGSVVDSGTLTIPGHINIEGNMTIKGWANAVPIGTIIMWANKSSRPQPEESWELCDGNNGRPNLTNRVPRGTINSSSIGNTGGNDSIVLSSTQLPRHNHGGNTGYTDGYTGQRSDGNPDGTHDRWRGGATYTGEYGYITHQKDKRHRHTISNSGSSASVDIKPRYTLVQFYIRVQ